MRAIQMTSALYLQFSGLPNWMAHTRWAMTVGIDIPMAERGFYRFPT
jgi:hypothetical protein